MIKLLDRLEHSKTFWALLGITLFFFLLRSPSLIEPNWYGDEGIYQVIGMAIDSGRTLYSEAWDNKPPLLYLTYALFHGDQFGVRLASLVIGLLATWMFFFLSQKLFKNLRLSIGITTLFAILFATPFIEGNIANAENFMLLPIISAGFLITSLRGERNERRSNLIHAGDRHAPIVARDDVFLFFAGLLLGIAFLFKIVALFDFLAFFLFLFIISTNSSLRGERNERRSNLIVNRIKHGIATAILWLRNDAFPIVLGFLLPITLTFLYFFINNVLGDFIRATFFGNIGYVGYGNTLIIPQGMLILKLLLLSIVTLFVFLKRNVLSKQTMFVLLWLAFSLFNAFFSQRPYTHYVLVMLPSFCLLVGLLFYEKIIKIKRLLAVLLVVVTILLLNNFHFSSLKKTVLYYYNTLTFITGNKNITAYQAFFDQKTPRDYQLASFIKMHTTSRDNIFVWGDSAQIYALANKLPPNKYTVAYHTTQSNTGITQTQAALNRIKPKYIFVLPEAPILPFRLPLYTSTVSFQGVVIYERTF